STPNDPARRTCRERARKKPENSGLSIASLSQTGADGLSRQDDIPFAELYEAAGFGERNGRQIVELASILRFKAPFDRKMANPTEQSGCISLASCMRQGQHARIREFHVIPWIHACSADKLAVIECASDKPVIKFHRRGVEIILGGLIAECIEERGVFFR